jgi:hypothetical protein
MRNDPGQAAEPARLVDMLGQAIAWPGNRLADIGAYEPT